MTRIILIGPPGAGCSSVAAAYAQLTGSVCDDLGQQVAQKLGTTEEFALITAGEVRYRAVEAETALALITGPEASGQIQGGGEAAASEHSILAIGSGVLMGPAAQQINQALRQAASQGTQIIALTASTRTLASRNGLDAPRSVALGNVNHAFTLMLHERNAACAALASRTIDTTDLTPQQAAAALR